MDNVESTRETDGNIPAIDWCRGNPCSDKGTYPVKGPRGETIAGGAPPQWQDRRRVTPMHDTRLRRGRRNGTPCPVNHCRAVVTNVYRAVATAVAKELSTQISVSSLESRFSPPRMISRQADAVRQRQCPSNRKPDQAAGRENLPTQSARDNFDTIEDSK